LRESLLKERSAYSFSEGLTAPYFLDYASVLAARSLRLPDTPPAPDAQDLPFAPNALDAPPTQPEKSFTVLDACAAPGGKSLVIASRLPPGALLLSNEFSSERRRRLADSLDKHLCGEKRRQVRVCGFDAAAQGRRKSEHGRYAAILVDAPCSSEAHVLKDERALAAWTIARPRFLAGRQWALLSSAFLLLEPSGSLVYATCAITQEENDGVARRLLKKYGAQAVLDPPEFSEGEKTQFGHVILPDRCGLGPLYVARFMKAAR
jgi:16S rRNA (cytosine1407-C5)-methyltransferase